jgi:hypothetical protein
MAIYKGIVKDGALLLPPISARLLQRVEGKAVQVELQPWSDSRTNRQNRYYWGCVIEGAIAAFRFDWGVQLTPQAAHDACRTLFLGAQPMGVRGVPVVRSSAGLSTAEFTAYIETIRHWALHDCGVMIPSPDEVGFNYA